MMEKYSELRWYMPPSFKDCLAKCRFEQGVVIFKDKPVGEKWEEEMKNIDYCIQIKFPPSAIGADSAMLSHWNSEVIFERFFPKTKEKETVKTTQGRLFSFLWKDDPEILHDTEDLPPPLHKISLKSINKNFIRTKIPVGSVGFAFIYNPVNDILIDRLNNIKKAASEYDFKELTFSIEESCIIEEKEKANGIYPLIKTKLLLFRGIAHKNIHDLIKDVVFKGKDEKNFNIKLYGVLI